jgi:hypothetical protein
MPKDTPARRAAARRDPAIALPPKPPEADRRSTVRNLHIVNAGVAYLIGPAIEGDPAMAATADGTETVTIVVRDPGADLQNALDDEAQLLTDAAKVTINLVVYRLQSMEVDPDTGTLVTLVFEDEVSWRLKQFSRFLTISRAHSTRAQAALRLVKEASAPPLAPLKSFIPELTDRQRIAAPASDETSSTDKGTGAASGFRVKRKRATAKQRAVLDGILRRADRRGASRRVMIGEVMAATQESRMGEEPVNGNHLGPFHQDPGWGSAAARRDPERASDAFLDAWKRIHGSVKHAPGDLAAAIEAVQRSGQGSLYAQWEDEATDTVDRWRGGDHDSGGGRTVVEPFEFTRGEKDGQRESSWDALARWASDVNWRRWAQANTLFYVSDDELRAAAPALEVHGDEPWLLAPPGGSWSPDRPNSETTMRVLAERWGVMIGASVLVATGTPARGRYIVTATDGYMVSPELTVTLRRPSTKKPEPPHDVREAGSSSDGGGSSSELIDACSTISKQDHPYVYGGGHGPKLSRITAHQGLDCSSSVSLALSKAGMFNGSVAITSGEFARSWGKPGKGREFTVWANGSHVWIELHDGGRYKRFDTSPHGSGDSGPHLRLTARNDQARFTARHWPGH